MRTARPSLFRPFSFGLLLFALVASACSDPLPPGAWRFASVDGSAGISADADPGRQWSGDVSVQNYQGDAHIYGVDRTVGTLLHSWRTDGTWSVEVLDDGSTGRYVGPLLRPEPTTRSAAATEAATITGVIQKTPTQQALRTLTFRVESGQWERSDIAISVPPRTPTSTQILAVTRIKHPQPGYVLQVKLNYPSGPAEVGLLRWTSESTNQPVSWVSQLKDPSNPIPTAADRIDEGYGVRIANPDSATTSTLIRGNRRTGDLEASLVSNLAVTTVIDGDGVGTRSSGNVSDGLAAVTTGSNAEVHAFYVDSTAHVLRHAWWPAGTSLMKQETLDGIAGGEKTGDEIVSKVSVAIIDGQFHVFYGARPRGSSALSATLRHAWYTATGWRFETFDGAGGVVGQRSANVPANAPAVITIGGAPVVAYSSADTGALRVAEWR